MENEVLKNKINCLREFARKERLKIQTNKKRWNCNFNKKT